MGMKDIERLDLTGGTQGSSSSIGAYKLAKGCALDIPVTSALDNARRTAHGVRSWYFTTQEVAMNTFYEHHRDSIRFGYRCFDRILLNGRS
jgi:hypothetical protein